MNNSLPFTYQWILKKSLEETEIKTILELGCGKGDFAEWFNKNNKYEITGTDIFVPYINIAKKRGHYKKILRQNLNNKLKFQKKSFDAVVCLQTLEHLDKDNGEKILKQLNKIAKKLIIISTPQGECEQDEYEGNKYQRHLSTWFPQEFSKYNYNVFGIGLKAIYGSESLAQKKLSILQIPLFIISFLMNPLCNKFPEIACQMVAVKKVSK